MIAPCSLPTPPVVAPTIGLSKRHLLLIFAVALALRAGWGGWRLVHTENPSALEFPDEQQYWLMAQSLRVGEGLRDELGFRATRMPLYPAVLSLFAGTSGGIVAAKVMHWFLGAGAAVLSAGLGAALFGRRTGIAAGLWVALDPFLVFFSSLLLTETPFLCALLAFWWMCAAWMLREDARTSFVQWVTIGLFSALCVYTRESSLGLVALLLLLLIIFHRFDRRIIAGAAIGGVITVMALLPWAARNRVVLGEWSWLTLRGGVSLYDGVGPRADGSSNLGDIQSMPEVRGLGEVEWDRYFISQSITAMRSDWKRMFRLAGTKIARTWNPFPNVETYRSHDIRILSAGWTIPTFAFAIGGLWRLSKLAGRKGVFVALLLLLPAMYISGLHSLFVGSVRYRLPAMPMIEVLAASSLVALLDRITRRRGA